MLTTFTVTNLNDATVTAPGQAPGTLRQAIYDANVSSDADIIEFAPTLAGNLRLSIAADATVGLSALVITTPITIRGSAGGITIRRDVTAPEMRFFRVTTTGNLTLESLSLTEGITRGTGGTAGQNGGSAFAGAIYNSGSVQLVSSTLYNNTSIGGNAGTGGNSGTAQGGAIYNDGGTVSVRNSTLSSNSVANGFGPVLERSYGGGIYSKNGALNVDNSTITNSSATSGRALYVIGIGAGNTASLSLRSSIIAQADVQTTAFDVNATDDQGGQVFVNGSNNLIRSHNAFPSLSVSSLDPRLGPLALNGGPTMTHSLMTDSPAIGQGLNPLSLTTDQRGPTYARVIGGVADIGAFEVQTGALPNLQGDYNQNNVVDAADYVLWRKTKGTSSALYAGADGNGNGTIDDPDYAVWRGNFGAVPPASGAEQSMLTVVDAPTIQPQTALPGFLLFELLTTDGHFNATTQSASIVGQLLHRETPSASAHHQVRDAAILAVASGLTSSRVSVQQEAASPPEAETSTPIESYDSDLLGVPWPLLGVAML